MASNKYIKNKIDENNPYTYVISKIDNKKFTRINVQYLKKHGLTLEEYCKKYNVDRKNTVSQQLRDSLRWTKEVAIKRYGPAEGIKKWEKYCKAQSESNTFKYKNKKYGMTLEEFNEYNKNRASTLKNFIKRYGDVEGNKKWKEYCLKQAYLGCSIEYFQEKYGITNGKKIYKNICRKKANTLESYFNRYGVTEGTKRYKSHFIDKKRFFSAISQLFFNDILKHSRHKNKVFFEEHQGEYSVMSSTEKRIYFYDFVDTHSMKCIEFNGDVFHANPAKYKKNSRPNPFCKHLKAIDIWKQDSKKIAALKQERNIDTLVVWESEYKTNKDATLKQALEFLGYA
jgi:hypothetical protein